MVNGQEDDVPAEEAETKCVAALRRYPSPPPTYTASKLFNCPELCRNSSGHFSTGQFPHPWDCNAFINCYHDEAYVAWCQPNLKFNENNMECDWPQNVNCSARRIARPDTDDWIPPQGCRVELCKEPVGRFEIPGRCGRFVNCWDKCAYVMKCPNRLVFNEGKKYCDYTYGLPAEHECRHFNSSNSSVTAEAHEGRIKVWP
ncbi:hypothetical protein BV898_04787 [Hypsibius exemplaris]|uniref:Chitin-binding type-2 domain-containing protein n=1 Tax=Hypsibius exemplaris TaxID=2072580 RepID=A0A1W0X1H3_HYPEX|nr:hypothetical protein BV898_04787 [Hypsibius exemplaris]